MRDASKITSAGFKGTDLEDMLHNILQYDPRAAYGWIFFDEFDELCKQRYDMHGTNVNLSSQGALLKVMEGEDKAITLDNGKIVDVSNMVISFCGAFVGLDKIYERQSKTASVIGFTSALQKKPEPKSMDIKKALIEYGMMPEIAGRIGRVAQVVPLSVKDYIRILELPGSIVKTLVNEFMSYHEIELSFSQGAKQAAAEYAYASGLGVRELESILQNAAEDRLFRAQKRGEKVVKITKKDIQR